MIRSLELVLDATTDAAVRSDWTALQAAGLPSLADHTGESNRPHVTLVASDEAFASVDLEVRLPLPIRLGGLLVFGVGRPRGMVLSRALVPSAALMELHASVVARAGGAPRPTSLPGAWTPHVTLARRLDASTLGRAFELLDGRELDGAVVGVRLWDAETKTVTRVAGEG
jgi:2'-5' RNA ligase